jgi:hypothetical protein
MRLLEVLLYANVRFFPIHIKFQFGHTIIFDCSKCNVETDPGVHIILSMARRVGLDFIRPLALWTYMDYAEGSEPLEAGFLFNNIGDRSFRVCDILDSIRSLISHGFAFSYECSSPAGLIPLSICQNDDIFRFYTMLRERDKIVRSLFGMCVGLIRRSIVGHPLSDQLIACGLPRLLVSKITCWKE